MGAELVGDLGEGGVQLGGVVAYVDDAAAGGFGEVVHGGFGVGEVGEVVGEGVGADEDDVEDGVRALGGFGGVGEGFLGALIAAVGEEDEDFAAGLVG